MAGTVTFDLSQIEANKSDFPNGPVEATIKEAKATVSKNSGNPQIELLFEIYHPDVGVATIRDWLPFTFPRKVGHFWAAYNNMTIEEVRAGGAIDIDPDELVGATLLLNLGEEEGTLKSGEKAMFKQIVSPWYFSDTRTDLLPYMQDDAGGAL